MARVIERYVTVVSKWVRLVRKEVVLVEGQTAEAYHCIDQADYVAVLAVLPDGRIPIVRQFRPAVEAYTFEFPAGLVEDGEAPDETARRELKEETGLDTLRIEHLGSFFSDTGRLQNRIHSYFVEASGESPDFVPEAAVLPSLVSPGELKAHIAAGRFCNQMHLGVLTLAGYAGVPWDRTGQ